MSPRNPYIDLAAPAVSELAPYLPGKPVAEVEREFGITDAVKLASNENPRGPSPRVREALARVLDEQATAGIARYPDGAGYYLRSALAEHLGVAPEQVTLGNGSNDVLVLLAETFLTPATSAIYDEYSFVVYRLAVQACGAEARVAASRPPGAAQALGHDLAAMRALVDETTRLLFIANPNNPTGTWVEQQALLELLRSLPPGVIVVLDEAYLEYARQPGDADAVRWLAEFPNLVIVRTFSKAYGLASLRVGYGVSAPGIAELLNRVRQPFNVNSLAQVAAIAALEDQHWIDACVEANAAARAELCAGLEQLGFAALPSRGNFVLADFGSAATAAACNDFLLRAGVIVRPVANYGLARYLRITAGTAAEVRKLLAALADFRSRS